jgi:hypothetical protein
VTVGTARSLNELCALRVRELHDELAFNEAGLLFLQRSLEAQRVPVFADVNRRVLAIRSSTKRK